MRKRRVTFRRRAVVAAVACLALASVAAPSSPAQVVLFPDDCFPPRAGVYQAAAPLRYATPAGSVELSKLTLSTFTACDALPKGQTPLVQTFDALLTGDLALDGVSIGAVVTTPKLTQRVRLADRAGKARTYEIELLQLEHVLDLPAHWLLRESPTQASVGQTTTSKAKGGQTAMDGFVDVFTELSVDDGATWHAAVDASGNPVATRLELAAAP